MIIFAAYWHKRIGMKKEYIPFVEELIELAIREDIGDGDHTSLATIPADARGKMQLLVNQDGIIAGIEVARMVFDRLDGSVAFDQRIEDGACVRRGDIAFYVEGRILSLLQAERIVLNIMQRMSGVATQTAVYVQQLEGLHTKVLDTRKTTPGMRVLDKMAVKLGGGENHRMGLFDMILLKDNHIDAYGGITPAVAALRKKIGHMVKIEVEVRTLEELEEALSAGADIIMLDNMSCEDMTKAVQRVDGKVLLEASGNVTAETIRGIAETGVDIISLGALTHSVKCFDISMRISAKK